MNEERGDWFEGGMRAGVMDVMLQQDLSDAPYGLVRCPMIWLGAPKAGKRLLGSHVALHIRSGEPEELNPCVCYCAAHLVLP